MVALVPMTADEFRVYRAELIETYAEDHVKDGIWSEAEAIRRSTQEIEQLLPQGVETPDHALYTIQQEGQADRVGILWYALTSVGADKAAFIYDIRLDPRYQGHGLGRETLSMLEEMLRPLGVSVIKLHVFGHNERAQALYHKVGYRATNILMAKNLQNRNTN